MRLPRRLRPHFWDHKDVASTPYRDSLNFRLLWKQSVTVTALVTIAPLIFMTLIELNVSRHAADSEINLRTLGLVSNTRRAVSYFLDERRAALDFIVRDNSLSELSDTTQLAVILAHLKTSFGGFTDLGVIDHDGSQHSYVGPYDLAGVNYSSEDWFHEVSERGLYISNVFLGVRLVPHFVIAIRHNLPDQSWYVVRATIDTARFNKLLSQFDVGEHGDAFIVDRQGVLQTPSPHYGAALDRIPLEVPPYSSESEVMEVAGKEQLTVGYAHIESSPFVLMICQHRSALTETWRRSRVQVLVFLVVSILVILGVVVWVSTRLVQQVFEADQRRVAILHEVEYANKMASIGRLAAGIAHEINNPLAIINEKAGLINDLFRIKEAYAKDERLLGLVDSITRSVDRCATITRRLLSFARHMGPGAAPETVHITKVVDEVIGFLGNEATWRSIHVLTDISNDLPTIETDRGKLQQILINLLNNAFAACDEGGMIKVKARQRLPHAVTITVIDNGCGIPKADLKRVFEPFFSTRTHQGGTGLGLSITHNLVRELGGTISVDSVVDEGTSFAITLPISRHNDKGEPDARTTR